MIIVTTRFTDDPVRFELRPAHRALLGELADEGVLVAAGPFADESGALLVFDCDRERVQQAIDADPYMTCAGVTITAIQEWEPVAGTRSMPPSR